MNNTVLLLIIAACSVFAMIVWRGKRRNNTWNRRARKLQRAVEPPVENTRATPDDAVIDEAEAYWGNSMPRGVAARELVEATNPLEELVEVAPEEPVAQEPSAEAACQLGLHLTHWLALRRFRLPDAGERYTEDDLLAAIDALEQGQPATIFAHGAALQPLGSGCALLLEPRVRPVEDFETFSRKLKLDATGAQLYLILGDDPAPADDAQRSAHMGELIKALDLPPEHFFLKQDDGSFHNFIEDQHHFVPARFDVEHLPEAFLERMLDYAQDRYEEGEPEAALRVLGPLEEPLGTLALDGHFDRILVARMLNLLGIAHREVGAPTLAVACFSLAERLVKDPCEPDALQIVHSNLGETLALYAECTLENLKRAAHHLREAIRLDDADVESLKTLGAVYLDQYELTAHSSLLDRAERAFNRASRLARDGEITEQLDRVATLKDHHTSLINLPVVRSTPTPVPQHEEIHARAAAAGELAQG